MATEVESIAQNYLYQLTFLEAFPLNLLCQSILGLGMYIHVKFKENINRKSITKTPSLLFTKKKQEAGI